MNNKNLWIVVVIIVILIVGYLVWVGTGASMMGGNMASSTPNGQIPAGAPSGAQPGTAGGPAAGTPGTTVPPGTPTYTAQITITGFTSHNQTDYPLVNYSVTSSASGQGFFSLIGQNTNTTVWGKNQAIVGTYSLDPNSIDVPGNEPSHKLTEGDYFIRLQDSTGKVIGESRPFRIAAGQVTGN